MAYIIWRVQYIGVDCSMALENCRDIQPLKCHFFWSENSANPLLSIVFTLKPRQKTFTQKFTLKNKPPPKKYRIFLEHGS
jgi:hypothetical protein